MANYEELLNLVCESVEDDNDTFKKIKKDIILAKKELKNAIKNKNPEEIKSKIDKLQDNIDSLKNFVDGLNPEDYGNEQDRQLKSILQGICQVMSLSSVFVLTQSDDPFTKLFSAEVGMIGVLWSFAIEKEIKTLPEFQDKVNSEIEKTQKCLDKIKAKCTKKNLLVEEDNKNNEKEVKESVDSIKLEIFESCHAGEISEEERDELLAML